eukprot:3370271-Rhodomonas_salina.1
MPMWYVSTGASASGKALSQTRPHIRGTHLERGCVFSAQAACAETLSFLAFEFAVWGADLTRGCDHTRQTLRSTHDDGACQRCEDSVDGGNALLSGGGADAVDRMHTQCDGGLDTWQGLQQPRWDCSSLDGHTVVGSYTRPNSSADAAHMTLT